LEADQVGSEHTLEDLFSLYRRAIRQAIRQMHSWTSANKLKVPTGQTPENLRTRPRSVDEHSDGQLALLSSLSTKVTESHGAGRLALRGNNWSAVFSDVQRLAALGNDGLLRLLTTGRQVRRDLVKAFPDHLRDEQEMVIVNDDEITGLVKLGDSLGEQEVGLLVSGPCWVGSGQRDRRVLPKEVVEQWPKSWERIIDEQGRLPVYVKSKADLLVLQYPS